MYLRHITRPFDRWDLIAHQYYGNAAEFERILAANPHAPTTATLPAGIHLLIPIIVQNEIVPDLPPWKR